MSACDYAVWLRSVLGVENAIHRKPVVLVYQQRTLRASFPSFMAFSRY